MTGNNRNNNGEITFEIVEHIGVLDVMDNREEKWTKEVNLVAQRMLDKQKARSERDSYER